MKTFKDKAYLPPVDKIRKDLGQYQEKMERKVILSAPKQTTASKPLFSNPTSNKKKKISFGAYFVLSLIFALTGLFIFMVFSLIFTNPPKADGVEI